MAVKKNVVKSDACVIEVLLLTDHIHAGVRYKAGTEMTVPKGLADTLVMMGVGTVIDQGNQEVVVEIQEPTDSVTDSITNE